MEKAEEKIPKKELFSNRKPFLEKLYLTIANIENYRLYKDEVRNVIAIDAQWGYGKTFFVNELNNALNSSNCVSIVYNSWENDYEENPLLSIVNKIVEALFADEIANKEIQKEKSSAKEALNNMVATALFITRNAIKNKTGTDIYDYSKDKVEADKILDSFAKLKTKSESISVQPSTLYQAQKNFITIMEKVVKLLDDRKFVIIIDELDRCRPSYAVELLERVKHLFNIEGIVFVFSINKEQLCEAVKKIHGTNRPEEYLKRFFDYEYLLPEPNLKEFYDDKLNILFKDNFYSTMKWMYENTICKINTSLRNHEKILNLLISLLPFYGKIKNLAKDENGLPHQEKFFILLLFLGISSKVIDRKWYEAFFHNFAVTSREFFSKDWINEFINHESIYFPIEGVIKNSNSKKIYFLRDFLIDYQEIASKYPDDFIEEDIFSESFYPIEIDNTQLFDEEVYILEHRNQKTIYGIYQEHNKAVREQLSIIARAIDMIEI